MTVYNLTAEHIMDNSYEPTPRFVWRHQYDVDADTIEGDNAATNPEQRKYELERSGIIDVEATEQHHKDDVDLNVMAERMGVSDRAVLPAALDPRYFGDVPEGFDLRFVLDQARDVENRFNQLPADLRERFGNDPAKLWRFIQDEKNDEEAVRIGLLKKPEPIRAPEPTLVKVVTDEPSTT